MKKSIIVLFLILFFSPLEASGIELLGEVTVDTTIYMDSPAYQDQNGYSVSLLTEVELYQQINETTSFTVKPFYHFTSPSSKRNHGDLRECSLHFYTDKLEVLLGLDKVFWGVNEFVHLVDIINQTDILEGLDGDEKLGQPMALLRLERDWGMIETFVLPYFRTRSFPGKEDRLRGPVLIDDSVAQFESSSEEKNVDLAIRYSQSIDNWDVGIYHFIGTSREPFFLQDSSGTALIPYYELIDQSGLDLQLTLDNWLLKIESLYRTGKSGEASAFTLGFEYTFSSLLETPVDLGILAEYVFDDRPIAKYSLFTNDLMAGIRLNLNDFRSTEILTGLIWDVDTKSIALSFEAKSRLNTVMDLKLTGLLLNGISKDDPLTIYQQDSYIKFAAIYYF